MLGLALTASLLAATPVPKLPDTPQRPATDAYHGEEVADPYRWLEDGTSPEVQAWSRAQDAHARAVLAALPHRKQVGARVRELMTGVSARYYDVEQRGGVHFALKFQPPRQQVFLVTFGSLDDPKSEKPLVDPNQLDPSGRTAIDFYEPSLDGKYVAVSLSKDGTEDGTVHVYEVASGKALADRVPRVNGGTAGGSLAWNADGTGFWYSRYPREGERPAAELSFFQQLYFHRLGTPGEQDTYVLGKDFAAPRIAQNVVETSEDGQWVVDRVAHGDGGEFEWWLKDPQGRWTRIATFADKVIKGRFGFDGALWLVSRKDAPRGQVLRLPLEAPSLDQARVVVPQSADAAIEGLEVTRTRLYVVDLVGGPSRVRTFALDGTAQGELPLLPVSTVSEVQRVGGDAVVYSNESFLTPPAWYRVEGASAPEKTALVSTTPVDLSDVEVVREHATSKDGTRVPVSILRRKGLARDGKAPALLWGYGGYGVSIRPGFSPLRKLWVEQGGVLAIANLRGGGEYGEEWHLQGNLARKQNVFDDYIAVAEHLLARQYTSSRRLALMGGSNGGLLMGAVLTQRPALAAAVVAQVGIFDMLRVELHPNGAFNVTEFGTVKDPTLYRALRAYSPFHAVKEGTAYPAVLLTAGNKDPRVDAYHARKMAAALQAATSSKKPVLLRVSDTGHGIGSALDERIEEYGDTYAFLFHQLGVAWRPPKSPPRPARTTTRSGS